MINADEFLSNCCFVVCFVCFIIWFIIWFIGELQRNSPNLSNSTPRHVVPRRYSCDYDDNFSTTTNEQWQDCSAISKRGNDQRVDQQRNQQKYERVYDNYRHLASVYAESRNECYLLSKKAFERKNFSLSTQYSTKAYNLTYQIEEANKAAAKAIFDHFNPAHQSQLKIDLHGLHVNEAIQMLKMRIDLIKSNDIENDAGILKVIVGRGKHSNKGPKIKPAVIQFAQNEQIHHQINPYNSGCICLTLTTEQNYPRKSLRLM